MKRDEEKDKTKGSPMAGGLPANRDRRGRRGKRICDGCRDGEEKGYPKREETLTLY